MSKEIEITVAADGGITVEGHGFSGAECEKATRVIEDELGERTESKRKAEYYQRAAQQQRIGR